jgi:hypothetical protein
MRHAASPWASGGAVVLLGLLHVSRKGPQYPPELLRHQAATKASVGVRLGALEECGAEMLVQAFAAVLIGVSQLPLVDGVQSSGPSLTGR